jgi:hypothetical protein
MEDELDIEFEDYELVDDAMMMRTE